jgi:hypothetical protein
MAQAQSEKKKAKVGEPAVSEDVARSRASHAFDIAASRTAAELAKLYAPPPSETSALSKMVSNALKESKRGETVDVGKILDEYIEANPDSKIAKCAALTGGSTAWIISPSTGRVAFNASQFSADFKTFVASTKPKVVDVMVKVASDRKQRSGENPLGQIPDEKAQKVLVAELARQVSVPGAKDPLPMDITYDNQTVKYASRTEPPPQSVEFKEDEKKRKG